MAKKAAAIKPSEPNARWHVLTCIVPVPVKDQVLHEAEHQGLSINQVVQNALYSRYGLPETPGTEIED